MNIYIYRENLILSTLNKCTLYPEAIVDADAPNADAPNDAEPTNDEAGPNENGNN